MTYFLYPRKSKSETIDVRQYSWLLAIWTWRPIMQLFSGFVYSIFDQKSLTCSIDFSLINIVSQQKPLTCIATT
jgi:hypothetical protein